MPLRLSPEVQAEYDKACRVIEEAKQRAIAAGNKEAAKKCRQAMHQLYESFKPLQLPEPPPTKWELEQRMTLEQRIERIEQHLKIGKYAEDKLDSYFTGKQETSPPWDE
jgi:hypothetical protein